MRDNRKEIAKLEGFFKGEKWLFLVQGACGVGKTYFINDFIKQNNKSCEVLTEKKVFDVVVNSVEILEGFKNGKTIESVIEKQELVIEEKANFDFFDAKALVTIEASDFITKKITAAYKILNYEEERNSPILFIDDLGNERDNKQSLELIARLLYFRHENGLKTIVTTNLSIAEISNRYGERIKSRFFDGIGVFFTGEDLREKQFLKGIVSE